MESCKLSLLVLFFVAVNCGCVSAKWQAAAGPLETRWTKDVAPDNVHKEYPRPQMVRDDWLNLNGLWDYAIRPKDSEQPEDLKRRK